MIRAVAERAPRPRAGATARKASGSPPPSAIPRSSPRSTAHAAVVTAAHGPSQGQRHKPSRSSRERARPAGECVAAAAAITRSSPRMNGHAGAMTAAPGLAPGTPARLDWARSLPVAAITASRNPGEQRRARTIARAIVQARPIRSTRRLVDAGVPPRFERVQPRTRG